jgi:uncharacterized protein (DUF2141 family)
VANFVNVSPWRHGLRFKTMRLIRGMSSVKIGQRISAAGRPVFCASAGVLAQRKAELVDPSCSAKFRIISPSYNSFGTNAGGACFRQRGKETWVPAQWRQTVRFFLALLILVLSTTPALSNDLRLTIDNVRSDSGEILIALYDDADGFRSAIANSAKRGLVPDSGRLIGTAIRAARGMQSTVFTQLPAGRYAIVVIHDENDNGRLDKNLWAMPIEGYGFGNNAQGFLSAPSFDAAAITIGNGQVSASINLIYPKSGN